MKAKKQKLSELEKGYIQQMNLWASNIMGTVATYENDIVEAARFTKRNKAIIAIKDATLKNGLKNYNAWRETKGLKPVKKFKYIK